VRYFNMARYNYCCKEHGEFEEIQKMDDEHIAKCPVCKQYGQRVYYSLSFSGDLPTLKVKEEIGI
jgi:putative FmdB family regulatory protein